MRQRGFGFIEIIIVVAIVAVAGFLLMRYFSATAKTVEKLQQDRPLARAKLAADQATLTSVQGMVSTYRAEKGQYPSDKAGVIGLLWTRPSQESPQRRRSSSDRARRATRGAGLSATAWRAHVFGFCESAARSGSGRLGLRPRCRSRFGCPVGSTSPCLVVT